jgi:hypothetical protein
VLTALATGARGAPLGGVAIASGAYDRPGCRHRPSRCDRKAFARASYIPARWRTHWATWSAEERAARRRASRPREALPAELVLDNVIVTPLDEQAYP